jgi:hypothetical protein
MIEQGGKILPFAPSGNVVLPCPHHPDCHPAPQIDDLKKRLSSLAAGTPEAASFSSGNSTNKIIRKTVTLR